MTPTPNLEDRTSTVLECTVLPTRSLTGGVKLRTPPVSGESTGTQKEPPREKRASHRSLTGGGRFLFEGARESYLLALQHPFFSTAVMGSMASLASLIGAFQGASPYAALAAGSWGLGMGIVADSLRYGMLHSRFHLWKKQDSQIAKVLDLDYFNEVVEGIRKEKGFKGPCRKIEAQGRPNGTGIFQGGYFTTLTLQFSGGNEIKLMYKYNQKAASGRGALVSQHLRDRGYLCVPRTYQLEGHTTRLGSGMGQGYDYRGELYEYLDGDSLENLILRAETATVQPESEIPRIAQSLFEQMRAIYTNPGLEKETEPGLTFGDDVPRSQFSFKLFQQILSQDGLFLHPDSSENEMKEKLEKLLASFSTEHEKNKFLSSLDFGSAFYKASLDTRRKHPTPEDAVTLVHGDLHQGNILLDNKGRMHIIDWDNTEQGIPYQDFFHFAVISDYERHPDYRQHQQEFLRWQSQAFPAISDEEIKLTEFQTYFSLLLRYHDTVRAHKIRAEFEPAMLQSCQYLLKKSRQALDGYMKISHREDMLPLFSTYCAGKFTEIESAAYNELASVAYAHHVNHHFRIPDKEEQALANSSRHLQKVESLVIAEERERNLPVAHAVTWGTMGASMAGLYAYAEKLDHIPRGWGAALLSLPVIAALHYYRENLIISPLAGLMDQTRK